MSVLTKRAINSMKTGQFILNSQIYAQRVPRGSTDAPEMRGSQGHRERLRITAPSENRVDILVLFPQRTQRTTGSAFRISFNLDWLMNNDIFNRPIMAHTQTTGKQVVIQNKDFGAVSLTGLTRVRFRVVAVNSCFAIIVTKPSSIARRITSKVRFLNF